MTSDMRKLRVREKVDLWDAPASKSNIRDIWNRFDEVCILNELTGEGYINNKHCIKIFWLHIVEKVQKTYILTLIAIANKDMGFFITIDNM